MVFFFIQFSLISCLFDLLDFSIDFKAAIHSFFCQFCLFFAFLFSTFSHAFILMDYSGLFLPEMLLSLQIFFSSRFWRLKKFLVNGMCVPRRKMDSQIFHSKEAKARRLPFVVQFKYKNGRGSRFRGDKMRIFWMLEMNAKSKTD